MGVHYDPSRRNYIVRQQDGGRRRTRRFDAKAEAVAFAKTVVTRDRGRPPSAGIDQDDQEVDEAVAALGRARARGATPSTRTRRPRVRGGASSSVSPTGRCPRAGASPRTTQPPVPADDCSKRSAEGKFGSRASRSRPSGTGFCVTRSRS